MGTRQEWGLLFCLALLVIARLVDLSPPAAMAPARLACPEPVEVATGAGESGLICGSGTSEDRAAQLRSRLPAPCTLPGSLQTGSRLDISVTGPRACQVRVEPMSGQHRLLVGQGIDPNRASAEDLQAIPGIGPALSARIIEAREREGPFAHLDDLDAVRGIGPKTLKRMAPYLIWPGPGR